MVVTPATLLAIWCRLPFDLLSPMIRAVWSFLRCGQRAAVIRMP